MSLHLFLVEYSPDMTQVTLSSFLAIFALPVSIRLSLLACCLCGSFSPRSNLPTSSITLPLPSNKNVSVGVWCSGARLFVCTWWMLLYVLLC